MRNINWATTLWCWFLSTSRSLWCLCLSSSYNWFARSFCAVKSAIRCYCSAIIYLYPAITSEWWACCLNSSCSCLFLSSKISAVKRLISRCSKIVALDEVSIISDYSNYPRASDFVLFPNSSPVNFSACFTLFWSLTSLFFAYWPVSFLVERLRRSVFFGIFGWCLMLMFNVKLIKVLRLKH